MKQPDAIKNWLAGVPLMVVEFRKSSAETINWRDKVTGKAMTAPVLKHTVETEKTTLLVNERVDETFDVSSYKSQFVKGAKVLLEFSEWHTEKGQTSCRGKLLPLEA